MATDPYKYFRIEARELLEAMTQGVLELEKGSASGDLLGRLLRHAHTLKGAARIVGESAVSDLSHGIEDLLAPYRQGDAPVPPEQISSLLKKLDTIGIALRSIESAVSPTDVSVPTDGPSGHDARGEARATAEEPLETVRVEISELDDLLQEVSEATIQLTGLKNQHARMEENVRLATRLAAQLGSLSGQNLRGTADSPVLSLADELRVSMQRLRDDSRSVTETLERRLARAQGRIGGLRLLSASTLFLPLERTIRDTAQSMGKRVDFETIGGDNRLDAYVLRRLREALVHVVRNAVAHGIESPTDRSLAGKPPVGHVQLRVERTGDQIAFICRDDGRGIDVEQIRCVAVQRGLVRADQAGTLTLQDATRLMFDSGFTTSRTVTQLAGRGIGLDVVRHTAAQLRGEVSATSDVSAGTTICIRVPVSLESLVLLEVDVAGQIVGVPMAAVGRVIRIKDEQIVRAAERVSILVEGKTIPFVPLASTLKRPATVVHPTAWSVLLLQDDVGQVAVGVDRVLRQTTVVMRPLPGELAAIDVLAGASFDSHGDPQPVVNVPGLMRAARQMRHSSELTTVKTAKLPLLIIDDSLTTRMLEQSILETAGYEVDLAISGEEALAKAQKRRYGVFIVDIEMPGMDGFEFIARTQAAPVLQQIPSILVTSRNAAEDRLRGQRLGAKAYIVKSDFNEAQFLDTIRRLVD